MPALSKYPSLFTHSKPSVLPQSSQAIARNLGRQFQKNSVREESIIAFRNELRELPADAMPDAVYEIGKIAQMHHDYVFPAPISTIARILQALGLGHDQGEDRLKRHSDLGWLLMFHGNGYVRQAAMEEMTTPPSCPFEVTAVVYRLNDWVQNVRAASISYAREYLPVTRPEAICESTFFVLPHIVHFKRWEDEAHSVLMENIYRPDVLDMLFRQFLTVRKGNIGRNLRLILRQPEFDGYLEQLALEAKLPIIRAIAVETLLMRRARWFVGYRHDWVSKEYGLTRRVAEYETRTIEKSFSERDVLKSAAQDRSSFVRRVLADYLILKRNDLTPQMINIVQELSNDKNAAMQIRMMFLSKKLASLP